MFNFSARSRMVTAVLCTLVGVASALAASAPGGAADAPRASKKLKTSVFRIVTTVSIGGDIWDAYRINTETGEVWDLDTTNTPWAWTKMTDATPIPNGEYDLHVISRGTGNSETEDILRIERKTGQAWNLPTNNTWTLITEPK